MNFYQPLKLRKNIISDGKLIDNMEVNLRAKTEHVEWNNQDSFYKQTSSFKKPNVYPSSTSILRSSRHEKPTQNPIPGVAFKQSPQDYPQESSSMDRTKSFSTIFTKNASTATYLHLSTLRIIKTSFYHTTKTKEQNRWSKLERRADCSRHPSNGNSTTASNSIISPFVHPL